MRIYVKGGEDAVVRLWLPTGFVFNRFSALFIPYVLKDHGINVTHAQAVAFVKAISDSRRRFKNWNLVEVHSSDGAEVLIRL